MGLELYSKRPYFGQAVHDPDGLSGPELVGSLLESSMAWSFGGAFFSWGVFAGLRAVGIL